MRRRTALAVLAMVALAPACAPSEAEDVQAEPPLAAVLDEADATTLDGPVAAQYDLDGTTLWVGSTVGDDVTATDAVLAEATMQVLAAAGAEVVDETELGAGILVRDALLSGEIDLYWEGTGRAWTALLRQPAEGLDGTEIATRLRARDLVENGVAWAAPAPFEVGSRLAVADRLAAEDDVVTLGDLGDLLSADEEALVCVTAGFVTFPTDGRVAVEDALGSPLPDDQLRVYEPEPIYPETGSEGCAAGLVESSSGRIPRYGLTVLEDDVGAFLPNRPAAALRADVVEDHPEVASLLSGLAAELTPEVIRGINRRVTLDGVAVDVAVAEWLAERGLV